MTRYKLLFELILLNPLKVIPRSLSQTLKLIEHELSRSSAKGISTVLYFDERVVVTMEKRFSETIVPIEGISTCVRIDHT